MSQAEAELFELPARPTLDPGNDGDWRDLGPRLLALDLKQDAALKVCKVSHDNLLSVVTKPAQVKP